MHLKKLINIRYLKLVIKEPLKILITILFCLLFSAQNALSDQDAINNFYIHKNCNFFIDQVLPVLNNIKDPSYPNHQIIIGLSSGIFIKYPDCKNKTLNLSKNFSQNTKIAILTSLYRAGLLESAKEFANQINYPTTTLQGIISINKVMPNYIASENDLLIGAYYATGDNIYLDHILHNFKTGTTQEVKDAIRIGLLMGKFGPALSPKNHKSKISETIKERYYVQKDIKPFLKITTMSSALWSLNSLAKKDRNLSEYLNSFFSNPKLSGIYLTEYNNFSNYLTLLTGSSVAKNDQITKQISDYEQLK